MADTSLIFSIVARDKTTGVLKRIQMQASSTGSIISKALGPAIAPIMGVASAGILGVGGALVSAGAAAGVFGGVMMTSMKEVTESATKLQDLRDKAELYGKQAQIMEARGEDNTGMLKRQAAATLELQARWKSMTPEMADATDGMMQMKSDWKDFVEANQPATFATLANGYKLIGQVIGKLQPLFDIGKRAADRLLASIQGMVNKGGIEKMTKVAGPAMKTLTSIIINVGTAVTHMFGKFTGQGQGILVWIEKATKKWAEWSSATKPDTGINRFVAYVSENGPKVIALLTSLASAAMNIAAAVSPLAPISLAVAGALAAIIAAVPPSVITALVVGWLAFNVALKAYAIYQGIATAAQWAYNVALLANPITWIIIGIVALIAVIVLIATKTTWFQTIWKYTWGFLKQVGAWFAGPFANFFVIVGKKIAAFAVGAWNMIKQYFGFWFGLYAKIWQGAVSMVDTIVGKFNAFIGWLRNIPGRIGSSLGNMFGPLWNGFRYFVNRIISGWNNLSFGIPGFSFAGISVPGINVGTPNIPYLAKGGHVTGEGMAFIHRGETVTPAAKVTPFKGGGNGQGGTITIKGDGSKLANLLLEVLRESIRDKGGDVVKVLRPR